ncbi:hypothetical protein K438DRAFT_1769347 [Mycena galopus ATCC 62051]|nr:hypothetical protein K438DRAFT_1769347 [Mycena galopus ATCC 62051]
MRKWQRGTDDDEEAVAGYRASQRPCLGACSLELHSFSGLKLYSSITGLVDAMFAPVSVSGTTTLPPTYPEPTAVWLPHTRTFEMPASTPADRSVDADNDHATDLNTEDGVPFGRSHHAAHATHPPPHLFTSTSSGSRPPSLPAPKTPAFLRVCARKTITTTRYWGAPRRLSAGSRRTMSPTKWSTRPASRARPTCPV